MTPGITLADAITALVAEKRAVGYKYSTEAQVLARFEAFCRGQFPGLGTVTQVSVEAWVASARRRGVKPATLQGLAAPVRELARWLGRHGAQAYVLPAGAGQARPLRPAHLHRPGTGGPVRPTDDRAPLLFPGPIPAPGHAGAVPDDLRLRGLRSSEARRAAPDVDHAGALERRMPRAAIRSARSRGRCGSRSRSATTPSSPGVQTGTGSSPAGPACR